MEFFKKKSNVELKTNPSNKEKSKFTLNILNENTNIILFFINLISDETFVKIIKKHNNTINNIDYLDYTNINIEKIIANPDGQNLLIDLVEWFVLDFNNKLLILDLLKIFKNIVNYQSKKFKDLTYSQKYETIYDVIGEYKDDIKNRLDTEQNKSKKNIIINQYILLFIIHNVYLLKGDVISSKLSEYNELLNKTVNSISCILERFIFILDSGSDKKEKEETIKLIKYFIELSFGKNNTDSNSIIQFLEKINNIGLIEKKIAGCEVFAIVDITKLLIKFTGEKMNTILKKINMQQNSNLLSRTASNVSNTVKKTLNLHSKGGNVRKTKKSKHSP